VTAKHSNKGKIAKVINVKSLTLYVHSVSSQGLRRVCLGNGGPWMSSRSISCGMRHILGAGEQRGKEQIATMMKLEVVIYSILI
jgi:hypothetical protein